MKIKAWLTRDYGGEVDLWFHVKPHSKINIWYGDEYCNIGTSDVMEKSEEAIEFTIDVPLEKLYKDKFIV